MLGDTGDTIVEVIIALAIISFVLATAYVLNRHNTSSLQNNAEYIQAQHIAESQIEVLRSQKGIVHSGDCYIDVVESGPAGCTFTRRGSGAAYKTEITGPSGLNPVVRPSKYSVRVSWIGLNDSGNDARNLTIAYWLN